MAAVPAHAEGVGVSRAQVQPWIDTLRGELLLRQGAGIEARRLLEGVAVTLRGLPGPDDSIQALFRLEALVRLARDVGDWHLPESLARHMLEHDSASGGTQLAVALVAEHRGNRSAAAVAYGDAAAAGAMPTPACRSSGRFAGRSPCRRAERRRTLDHLPGWWMKPFRRFATNRRVRLLVVVLRRGLSGDRADRRRQRGDHPY